MLDVTLILSDCARTVSPCFMVDYAKNRQLCSRLCSLFLLPSIILLAVHSACDFVCFWLVLCSFFVVSLARIRSRAFLFSLHSILQRCSTPQTIP